MFGILLNGLCIIGGSLLGGTLNSKNNRSYSNMNTLLGLFIIFMSILGFLESAVKSIACNSLSVGAVIFCFLGGSFLGESVSLERILLRSSNTASTGRHAFITGLLLFGIGSMQITGPITAFANGDNSQLILKAVIDLVMAFIVSSEMGKGMWLSAFPVAFCQLIIGFAAYYAKDIFTPQLIRDLCIVGYFILFFSGYNCRQGYSYESAFGYRRVYSGNRHYDVEAQRRKRHCRSA